ncbi:hypothetical protein [Lysobacter sp. ESA13C]|uniref:hypothetical protein n=1 Tax=Lysobacter sp. ESA13C TaxID=2862676 RepID=UPI001CBDD9A3|nr:hypothetical protein [Lysobacter sp. ESA13C]
MHKTLVIFVGMAAAALVPAIGLNLPPTLIDGTSLSMTNILFIPLAYMFVLPIALVFGVPMVVLFDRLNLVNVWTAMGSGACVGAIATIVIRLPAPPLPRDLLVDCPLGLLSGIVFWLVWRWNYPDRLPSGDLGSR